MKKRLGVTIVAASLLCGGAHAATYPAIYSFGDSLSDAGNVRISSLHTLPKQPPYFNGRFSNGLNWLDDLTAKLGVSDAATPSLAGGDDFAFGGAQTGATIVSDNPLIPTLDSQVQVFFKQPDPLAH